MKRPALDRAVIARYNRLIVKQANGCWISTSTNTSDGYTRWRYKPGAPEQYLHVWAYLAFVGDIPTGMQVDHRCHSEAVAAGTCEGGDDCPHRRCCRPEHLELVSASENTMRQRHHNRGKDSCPKGHPLSGDNLVVWKDGKRRCRECLKAR